MHFSYVLFVLHGEKLKGEFSLVKTKERGDNAWLLIKKKDKYASKENIEEKDKSILSGKTLEEVKANPQKEWESNRAKKTGSENENTIDQKELQALLKKGEKSKFLSKVKPMLCTLIKEPFDDADFLYEVKLDGYRIIAYVQKEKVVLRSRSGLDYSKKYPEVVKAFSDMYLNMIVEGKWLH